MANFDHLSGTNVYQGQVTNNLNTAFKLYSNYDQFGYVFRHTFRQATQTSDFPSSQIYPVLLRLLG